VSRGISEGVSKTQTRGTASGTTSGTNTGLSAGIGVGFKGIFGVNVSVSKGKSSGRYSGTNESDAYGSSRQTSEQRQTGRSDTESTATGTGKSVQITLENRSVKAMLEKIDLHIKRIEQCESFGAFDCATYVIADDRTSALTVAGNYNALLRGDESFLQSAQINTWSDANRRQTDVLFDYLNAFSHPNFDLGEGIEVRPSSLIGGREMAIQFGLPKKSIDGLTVLEMTPFGRNATPPASPLRIGNLFYMGKEEKDKGLSLDVDKLRAHVFITGSTGAGKSNAIYRILDELQRRENPVPFLVIEPAKGEYKHVFHPIAKVYGTNADIAPLLRVNPFAFPPAIHVLEHIDRLIEIFNVCWPMYAAMPAVLKDATLRAYASCGWDLSASRNAYGDSVFPGFIDLREELARVIGSSDYSEELKGNYLGALGTRVNSLTNGLNKRIFTADEIGDEELFDKNVIIDLSRVGSYETKALIMGVLVMRLTEYRMAQGGMNLPLRHVTVLEEAHNLLRRASFEQSAEGSNLAGKSVEMLSNAIAEMRSYGEGFFIADQAPGLLDLSAIRNTNTKIILRVPELGDRELVGRAAALNDGQIAELAKLETGVAAVYQNDWLEAALCKIDEHKDKPAPYVYAGGADEAAAPAALTSACLKLLLRGRCADRIDAGIDADAVLKALPRMSLSTKNRLAAERHLRECTESGCPALWETERFGALADIVAELLDARQWLEDSVRVAGDSEALHADMERRIRDLAPEITSTIALETAHALMRHYAGGGETQRVEYERWHNYIERNPSFFLR
jgi:DNA helicase HerA-like ATPase